MADIVFIYPKTGFDIKNVSIELPLSVIYASSFVKDKGYNIKIIDQRIDDNWQKTLKQELKKNPFFVGISSMTGTQIYHGLESAKFVKEFSDAPVVWGGIHPTLLPIETIKNKFVDIVVKGEGERTLLEIADSLDTRKSLSDIKGICYKTEKSIKNNADRKYEDLEKIPEIPYDLINIRSYLKINGGVFSTVYSRGCPFGCAFCCNPLLSQRKWRTFNTKRIINEIENMYEKYHFKQLRFNDENFFVDQKRVDDISKAIGNRFEWAAQARIDSANKFGYGLLAKRGLLYIQPGIESGNDRILSLIKKGINVQKIIDYNRLLAKQKITVVYNFMMGLPTETIEEVYDSINLSLKLIRENENAEISAFYIYVPYPGTELYDLSIKEGFKAPTRLEDWAIFNRQQLHTPWIKDNIELYKNIAITSKFIDGKRINRLFERTLLPSQISKLLSKIYKKGWGKKDFKNHIDIKLIDFTINKIVKVF